MRAQRGCVYFVEFGSIQQLFVCSSRPLFVTATIIANAPAWDLFRTTGD